MSASGDHDAREAPAALEELRLADWRREVAELYAGVRRMSSPVTAHALWREGRDRLFRTHPQSPLRTDDPLRSTGLPYWPYDQSLRFVLPLIDARKPGTRALATGAGEVTRMRQIGWVALPAPVGGRLAVWWLEQYGGGLFVPFRDSTAGTLSYGAGRYLIDSAKGADLGLDAGRLIIDLNFAYHPSCRYDPAWMCPLAPRENILEVAVQAGERLA